jgi:hypothetical protein
MFAPNADETLFDAMFRFAASECSRFVETNPALKDLYEVLAPALSDRFIALKGKRYTKAITDSAKHKANFLSQTLNDQWRQERKLLYPRLVQERLDRVLPECCSTGRGNHVQLAMNDQNEE